MGCVSSSTSGNRFLSTYVKGFVDVSGGNVLLRAGPTNNNHLILQGGDISLNGRLNVATGTSVSVYNNFYGKVPPTNVYLSSFSPNTTNATSNTWINNNVSWTVSSSSYDGNNRRYPWQSFDTSINNDGWGTKNAVYSTTAPFGYSPGANTAYSTYVNGVGTVSGEWLQIGSSIPVVMGNYKMHYFGVGNAPVVYIICRSNDNNNWFPVFDVSYTSWVAITSGQVGANGLSFTIPTDNLTTGYTGSSTGNGTTSCNYKYNSFGNGLTSYLYYRMIFKNTIGTGLSSGYTAPDGYCWFQEWTPIFSPATQTGPSRALIYMDASNINQVDVSGSLGLINSSPPSTMTVSPNTTAATSKTWTNNNVSWTVSASSTYATISAGNGDPYRVFDNTLVNSGNRWLSGAGNVYSTTAPYNYIAAVPFNTSVTGITTGVTQNISGEWVQIQSSIPLILNSYNIANDDVTGRTIKTFYIVASNDQNNWFPIQSGTSSTNPYGANTMSYVSPTTNFSLTGGTTQNGFTVTTYSNYTGNAYTYFRIIITNNYGGAAAAIGEWLINFTPATSSVSLALDNITPNQLNIGGQLSIGGLLTTSGAASISGSLTTSGGASIGGSLTTSGGASITGSVGIGTTAPAFPLDVTGIIRSTASYCGIYRIGQIVVNANANVHGTYFTPQLKNTYGSGYMVYNYFISDSFHHAYGIVQINSAGDVMQVISISTNGYTITFNSPYLVITNTNYRNYAAYVTFNSIGPSNW